METNYYFSEFEPISIGVDQTIDFSHLNMGFIN